MSKPRATTPHSDIRRVRCLRQPEMFGAIDSQITPGRFYTVLGVDPVNGEVFYTIVGNEGVEIQRSVEYFRNPDGK